MEKELGKKSYKLFIAWLMSYISTLILCVRIMENIWPDKGGPYSAKVIGVITLMMLCILFVVIYKTEKVYWVNGISYKEALNATSTQRKIYAKRHLDRFLLANAVYVIYCGLDLIMVTNIVSDICVLVFAILVATLSTIPIKLQ